MEEKKASSSPKGFIFWAIICLLVGYYFYSYYGVEKPQKPTEISFGEFINYAEKGEIKPPVIIQGSVVSGKLKNETSFLTVKERGRMIGPILEKYKVAYTIQEEPTTIDFGNIFSTVLIILIPIAIFFFLFGRMIKGVSKANSSQMTFGKARAHEPTKKDKKTFADVAGIDEAVERVKDVVDFLKDPEKYSRLGAKIPKGILLVGVPGTGKTLLAQAVAGEADAAFLSISGSDFVEMFVGVGASRVRDLFLQAKTNIPSIIFIDEIDAVGRHRGAGMGGGHDEREQTLNQILVEMDGFENDTGVIIMAATNRPDILDPALLRPGRFDRRVVVPEPDIHGRQKILEIHSKGKRMAEDVDLKVIAAQTAGMTGAHLKNILNEAAIIAAKKDKNFIELIDIEEAEEIILVGEARKSYLSDDNKHHIAVHEIGHTITHIKFPKAGPFQKVSIVPRGQALGLTWSRPDEDRVLWTKEELESQIICILGGRAAEEVILGREKITTGASNDLERATKIIREMVGHWGMDDKLGLLSFPNDNENPFLGKTSSSNNGASVESQNRTDNRARELLDGFYEKTKDIIKANLSFVKVLIVELIKKETLDAKDIEKIRQSGFEAYPPEPIN